MRHRGLEPICAGKLIEALARVPIEHHVVWTGHACGGHPSSLRARALSCVDQVGVPLPLRTLIRRAATLDASGGLDPDAVRSAVRTHQGAQPATYFLVARTPADEFVAVTDIPRPAGMNRRISAGEVLVDAEGRTLFECAIPELAVVAAE